MLYLLGSGLAGMLLMAGLWAIFSVAQNRRTARSNKLVSEALVGVWVEHIPGSIGRSLSVGKISFDTTRNIYLFDGTNYRDDLQPYCFWQTASSTFDSADLKFYYTFKAQVVGELDRSYYGFGVVTLGKDNGGYIVEDGHYISANVDGKPMSHTMYRPSVLQAAHSYKKIYAPQEMVTIIATSNLPKHLANPDRKAS